MIETILFSLVLILMMALGIFLLFPIIGGITAAIYHKYWKGWVDYWIQWELRQR